MIDRASSDDGATAGPGTGRPRLSLLLRSGEPEKRSETLTSLANQTVRNFEVLDLDDPATPLARLKNEALRSVRAPLVSTLAAGDRLAPHFVERMTGALDAAPDVAFAAAGIGFRGASPWELKLETVTLPGLLIDLPIVAGVVVRREAIDTVGSWDETIDPGWEDLDLWIRLAARRLSGLAVGEILVTHDPGPEGPVGGVSGPPFRLVSSLVRANAASYRTHAFDTLLRLEARSWTLYRDCQRNGSRIETWLLPALARQRAERDRLAGKLEAAQRQGPEEAERLRRALDEARAEIAAFKASNSWRLTAPLRALYDRFVGTTAPRPEEPDHGDER